MTQSSRKDSTGRKSLKEGPHGGAQDEGPCRDQLDDDGELLRSTRCIEKWTQRLSFSSTLSLTTIMAMQSKVDELGGKIMVSNCQDETFTVSVYVQGGADDDSDEDPRDDSEPENEEEDRKLAKIVEAMTRAYLKSEDCIFAMQQRNAYRAETQCRGMQSKVGVEAPLAGIDQATVDIADIEKAAVDNEDNFAVAAEDNFADAGYNLQAKSAESTPELRAEALFVITVADFGGNLATAVPADAPDDELADLATVEPFSVHDTQALVSAEVDAAKDMAQSSELYRIYGSHSAVAKARKAYQKQRSLREAELWLDACASCLEQPGGYRTRKELDKLQYSKRVLADYFQTDRILSKAEQDLADAHSGCKRKFAVQVNKESVVAENFGGNLATAVPADAPDDELADSATVDPFSVHDTLVGETAKAKFVVDGDGNSADQGYEECEDWTLHMTDEETVALLAMHNDFQFGDEPYGTLPGGSSPSVVSWDNMLGGKGTCFFGQCQFDCRCPPSLLSAANDSVIITESSPANVLVDGHVVDVSAANVSTDVIFESVTAVVEAVPEAIEWIVSSCSVVAVDCASANQTRSADGDLVMPVFHHWDPGVGETTPRPLSEEEQGLAQTQACNHKRKRDRQMVGTRPYSKITLVKFNASFPNADEANFETAADEAKQPLSEVSAAKLADATEEAADAIVGKVVGVKVTVADAAAEETKGRGTQLDVKSVDADEATATETAGTTEVKVRTEADAGKANSVADAASATATTSVVASETIEANSVADKATATATAAVGECELQRLPVDLVVTDSAYAVTVQSLTDPPVATISADVSYVPPLPVDVGTSEAKLTASTTATPLSNVPEALTEADVIKATEANSVADTAAATAVTTETAAAAAAAGWNVVEVSLTALQPESLMNEATCKLADSGSTEVNINIDAATGFTEVKVKTATDVVKAIEATSVAVEATATATATAGTADAAEVKFEATSMDEPLLVNTAFADEVAAGAATEAVSADTKFKACVVEADIGEAKLPKFVGVAAEVVAKAHTAEAVDAKAAKVEVNAEVAADAQAATYAPVTADVVQSASCTTTTATATADAIEANSVIGKLASNSNSADAPSVEEMSPFVDEMFPNDQRDLAEVLSVDEASAVAQVVAAQQQQQANDTNIDCQAWTHSWHAPLSNAGMSTSVALQEQLEDGVAVDTLEWTCASVLNVLKSEQVKEGLPECCQSVSVAVTAEAAAYGFNVDEVSLRMADEACGDLVVTIDLGVTDSVYAVTVQSLTDPPVARISEDVASVPPLPVDVGTSEAKLAASTTVTPLSNVPEALTEAVDAQAAEVEATVEVAADAQAAVTVDVAQFATPEVAADAQATANADAQAAAEAEVNSDVVAADDNFVAAGDNLKAEAAKAKPELKTEAFYLKIAAAANAEVAANVLELQAKTQTAANKSAGAAVGALQLVSDMSYGAMLVTDFPFGDKPYGTPTTVGGNKAASNLSVIDWQQKQSSPVKPQPQASTIDETVKVGSVTARVVTLTQTNSAGQLIFQVEQPSAWSPSLSGSVTVRKILESNACSISPDALQELIEADIAPTATSSISGSFARNVSIQVNKHPRASYAFNRVAKVISRLSKWEYHFEATTAAICKTGLDLYVSTFQVLLLASFLCCTMLTGWSPSITLWQWNKEFKQRSMNGLDISILEKGHKGHNVAAFSDSIQSALLRAS